MSNYMEKITQLQIITLLKTNYTLRLFFKNHNQLSPLLLAGRLLRLHSCLYYEPLHLTDPNHEPGRVFLCANCMGMHGLAHVHVCVVCAHESFKKFRYNRRFVCSHASYMCVVETCVTEPQNGPITKR